MKANKKLIDAFRKVAIEIREGTDYDWDQPDTCNCGLLAQELGVTPQDIDSGNIHGYWETSVIDVKENPYCTSTLLKMEKVFTTLIKNGVSLEDIPIIENCGLKSDRDFPVEIMYQFDTIGNGELTREKVKEYASNWFFDQANLMEAELSRVNQSSTVPVKER